MTADAWDRVFHPTEFNRAYLYALELAFQELERSPQRALIITIEAEHEYKALCDYQLTYNPDLRMMPSEDYSSVIITTQ